MTAELGIFLALGASIAWAFGTVLSFRAATTMGAFAVTRIQMISASLVLALLALANGPDPRIAEFWISVGISSVIGVLIPNLAFMACLGRAGPAFAQVLFATRTPITALLGFFVFNQTLVGHDLAAIATVTAGVAMVAAVGSTRSDAAMPSRLWAGITLGLIAAAGNAVGVMVLLPAIEAGVHPLTVSAARTGVAALLLMPTFFIGARKREAASIFGWRQLLAASVPGILGYVVAVTLQLWSLLYLQAGVAAALSSLAPVLVLPIMWAMTGKAGKPLAWAGAAVVCAGVALLRM